MSGGQRDRRPWWHRSSPDERGVSDVVAFVLVFGIVLSSVALVSVVAFDGLETTQDREQLQNADRAMAALSENADDVARQEGIDERSSELALRQGTIETGGANTTLVIDAPDVDGDLEERPVELGALAYEHADERVVYEGGAVIRATDEGDSATLSDPLIAYSDATDTLLVTLVVIEDHTRTLQSTEVREVTVTRRGSPTVYHGSGEVEMWVEGESPQADAWASTLERHGEDGELRVTAESVQIRLVEVEVDF